jgi:hypothetical protein
MFINNIVGLQLKIVAEDKVIDSRIKGFVLDWEADKSVIRGNDVNAPADSVS